jgi:hypothetical protein
MSNNNRIHSGKVKKIPSANVSSDRYEFISLGETEPDLGVPANNSFVLTANTDGSRTWTDPSNLFGFIVFDGGTPFNNYTVGPNFDAGGVN